MADMVMTATINVAAFFAGQGTGVLVDVVRSSASVSPVCTPGDARSDGTTCIGVAALTGVRRCEQRI